MNLRVLGRLLMGETRKPDLGTVTERDAELALAVDSYRYLLRTAPPLAIERAHTEAMLQLTLEQRGRLLRLICRQLPDDQQRGPTDLEPRALARLATRSELCRPGLLERALGAGPSAAGEAGGLLARIARAFTATPIAQQFLGGIDYGGTVTDWATDADLDYESLGYETPPVDCFVDRNGVAL